MEPDDLHTDVDDETAANEPVSRPDGLCPYDTTDPAWRELSDAWNERWDTATNGTIPPPEFIIEVREQVRDVVTTGFHIAAFVTPGPYTWVDYAVHLSDMYAVIGTERLTIGPMPEHDEDGVNVPGTAVLNEFILRYLPVDPDAELRRLTRGV